MIWRGVQFWMYTYFICRQSRPLGVLEKANTIELHPHLFACPCILNHLPCRERPEQ